MGRAEAETIQVLRANGQAYQADLVRATGFSRATISEVLASLERRKIVRRVTEGRNSRIIYSGSRRKNARTLRVGFPRAAEYPFVVPLRRMVREEGVELAFSVYENGAGVARDLSSQRLDLGIAPLVTLFMMHSLDAPFKIIGPAGSGGSSVLVGPRRGTTHQGGVIAVCTRLSTMEILIRSAENHHDIPEIGNLAYASTPSEIGVALFSGAADMCSIWEPYATLLEARGAKRVLRYSELSDHVCCALAAGDHLGDRLLSMISLKHASAMDAIRRDPDSCSGAYAALAGLDSSMVRRVSGEYTYPLELSGESVADQLRAAHLTLPCPSSFTDALYRM